MIPYAEILALRGEWSLRADVIEKDYVLGWMLAAIAAAVTAIPMSRMPEIARRNRCRALILRCKEPGHPTH